MAFVGILSQITLLFSALVIQLVWYTLKKIIHHSVGESGGCRGAVIIHHYSPPLRWIIILLIDRQQSPVSPTVYNKEKGTIYTVTLFLFAPWISSLVKTKYKSILFTCLLPHSRGKRFQGNLCKMEVHCKCSFSFREKLYKNRQDPFLLLLVSSPGFRGC